jgi:hypothetical protein
MKQLNRKQIIVCKQCHIQIHAGKYDGIKMSELTSENEKQEKDNQINKKNTL